MKTTTMKTGARAFILLSAMGLLSVSLMALYDPQSVMSLVNVQLGNNDAYSSIRGVYGGTGIAVFISLLWLAAKEPVKGLAFLTLFWGCYALSRLITMLADGPLGAFGNQWMLTEALLCITGLVLLWMNRKPQQA